MDELINSDLFQFIYAFGIGQAILLSILLLRKKANILSNRMLALVFILCSVELISGVFYLGEYYKEYTFFIGWTNGFAYLFGPLLYFYIHYLKPEVKFSFKKILPHFIPFMTAYVIYVFPLPGASESSKLLLVDNNFIYSTPSLLAGTIAPFHSTIYIFFLLIDVYKIFNSIKLNYSSFEFLNLYWLKYFFYGVLIQALIVVSLHIFEASFHFDIQYLMLLSVAVFMILAGYISLRQPDVKSLVIEPVNNPETKKEYKNPSVKKEKAEDLIFTLKSTLEGEKLYLNPKLSLKDLSEKTGISTHNLTEIINTHLNLSFYELINSYRVKEVKQLIADDKEKQFSLLGLAYEAGFSSKTSFNTIFKKSENKTPSEYRTEINKSIEAGI